MSQYQQQLTRVSPRKYPQPSRVRRTAIFIRMLPLGGLGYMMMVIVVVTVLFSMFEKTMEWQQDATIIAYRAVKDIASIETAAGGLLHEAQLAQDRR